MRRNTALRSQMILPFTSTNRASFTKILPAGAKGGQTLRRTSLLVGLVHDITHKVPFRIWPGILKSDEAIVAVLAHEMHEILTLRPFLERGEISIDDYVMHTEPGRPGNLHDEAWDVADRMVDKMRGVSPQ